MPFQKKKLSRLIKDELTASLTVFNAATSQTATQVQWNDTTTWNGEYIYTHQSLQ